MKKRKNLFAALFPAIFMTVGMLFLIGGVVTAVINWQFREKAVEITAVITDIQTYRASDGDRKHEVYVSYRFEDREYEDVRLNFYSSSMYEGKEITVFCDPENPRHIESSGTIVLIIVFVVMGAVFVVIGSIPIVVMRKRSARKKRIIAAGRVLYALVEKIDQNTRYEVNGQHPYLIYCTYRDDYKDIVYRFKSDNIWTDPSLVLHPGDTVKVYVDEKDYSCYYVDAESILDGKVVDYT